MDHKQHSWRLNLAKNVVFIVTNLQCNGTLFAHLRQVKVLTTEKKKQLREIKAKEDRNQQLINHILKGSEEGYYKFLRALLDTKQKQVAEKIEGPSVLHWKINWEYPDNNSSIPFLDTKDNSCRAVVKILTDSFSPSNFVPSGSNPSLEATDRTDKPMAYILPTDLWFVIHIREFSGYHFCVIKGGLGNAVHRADDVIIMNGVRSSACIHNDCLFALDWCSTSHRLLRYNIESNQWSRTESTLNHCLSHWFLLSLDNTLYIYALDNDYDAMVLLCLNSSTKLWHLIDSSKATRSDFSVASFGSNLYVNGGKEGWDCTTNVMCYNTSTYMWERRQNMLHERKCHASAQLGEYIYVCGGIDDNSRVLCECEKYDISEDVWHHIAPMKKARYYFSITVVNNKLVAIGGLTDEGVPSLSIEIYCPRRNSWTVAPNSLNEPRFGHSAVAIAHNDTHQP